MAQTAERMTGIDYGEFQRLLMDKRLRIWKNVDSERAQMFEQQQQALGTVGDVGDASVEETNTDFLMTLAANDRHELLEIQEAFERMRRGTYGICETCELPIAVERLRRLPEARRCIDCQSALESRRGTVRPQGLPKL